MSIYMNHGENFPADTEACYEIIASQEEFYLEETEQDLRAILIFGTPGPSANVAEQPQQAAEELITGDADDPPLSEETIAEMLKMD